ncbi:MAG: hypothetical protein ACRDKU_05980 [Gaiellaceae bacterium]
MNWIGLVIAAAVAALAIGLVLSGDKGSASRRPNGALIQTSTTYVVYPSTVDAPRPLDGSDVPATTASR